MDETDDLQWNKNYRKLAAVEELSESNGLVDLFVSEHLKKYKTKPLFPLGNTHLTTIQDIRKIGGTKTADLIRHFFHMSPQSLRGKPHSLETLKWQINEVNVDYEKRKGVTVEHEPHHIKIQFHRECIKCGERNEWVGFVREVESNEVCIKCRN